MKINLHAITFGSTVNGPGRRHLVHTRGCTLACPGCFNTATHPAEGGIPWDIDTLTHHLLQEPADGITFSGGEPVQQLPALLLLLKNLRAQRPDLSLLMFSGYTRAEIEVFPGGTGLLSLLDVLVDGRFDVHQPTDDGLRGSANQQIHLLSHRHTPEELAIHAAELLIYPDGRIVLTGFPSPKLVGSLRHLGKPT